MTSPQVPLRGHLPSPIKPGRSCPGLLGGPILLVGSREALAVCFGMAPRYHTVMTTLARDVPRRYTGSPRAGSASAGGPSGSCTVFDLLLHPRGEGMFGYQKALASMEAGLARNRATIALSGACRGPSRWYYRPLPPRMNILETHGCERAVGGSGIPIRCRRLG